MMKRRTCEEWLALFEEHKTSGLNITAFCKMKSLEPKYFSLRRKQLLSTKVESAFVRASAPRKRMCSTSPDTISLQGAFGTLSLPDSTSPEWLASFIKSLT
jgi:hypothetical protein|tara:strand:- start:507 stop:809 length:303 start_codon:yes stop_codon:yes gene_type:complete